MTRRLVVLAAALGCFTLLERSVVADQTAPKTVTCEEKIPQGGVRPKITETFPGEVLSGYEARLELEVRHGKGETVLPSGFKVNPGSDTSLHLEVAGFAAADPQGGAPPSKETEIDGDSAVTKVTIPFIVLPKQPGTRSLTLPSLPISVARASGETMTVCTQLHLVTAIDPTAAEADPAPRPSPDGRPQREDWPLMKWVLGAVLVGLVVGGLIAWWVRKQLEKRIPDAGIPRRLPWEEAQEEIAALRRSPLLSDRTEATDQRTELYDKVSDTIRKYLGARYGFEGLGLDGLETTTDEMMSLLRRVRPTVPEIEQVRAFLAECDLVKFARVEPTIFACKEALDRAEAIVLATIPGKEPTAPAPSPPATPPPAPRVDPEGEPELSEWAGPRPKPPAHKTEVAPPPSSEVPP